MARALTVLLSILAAANPLLSHVGATPVDTTSSTSGQVILGDIDPPKFRNDNTNTNTINLPNPETDTTSPPTWFESTLLARRLLALSKTGSIASTFPTTHPLAGHPIALPEYIADCERNPSQGNPTLLALPVSTTVRNAAAGANVSLSLDWWAHVGSAPPVFPGFPPSEAGLPRVTLVGYLERMDFGEEEEEDEVRECFLEAHPDARAWLPGKKGAPHESYWARLVVRGVYWVGGFGGLQQIGWVDLGAWRGVSKDGNGGDGGDGRGWGDVRLPGE